MLPAAFSLSYVSQARSQRLIWRYKQYSMAMWCIPVPMRILHNYDLLQSHQGLPRPLSLVQNTALTLQQRIAALQQSLQENHESIKDKEASLAALHARKQGAASGVADGAKRSLQASNSLRNAQAHQALRASLLCEKQELIAHLQEELGQVRLRLTSHENAA